MALPKRKTSKARRDQRRAQDKIQGPNTTTCPECGEPRLPHHACPECGAYKGRTVIDTEKE